MTEHNAANNQRRELLEVANRLEILARRNRFAMDVLGELRDLRAKVLDVTPEYEPCEVKSETALP